MSTPNFILDLDRSLTKTMREQASGAIIASIQSGRPGFCIGDRITLQELSRQNAIHRNTLAYVMSDLVRQGFLRRLPNKGFIVVQQSPDRPSLLTRHILSLSEVAQRDNIDSRSKLIPEETCQRTFSQLTGDLTRVRQDLDLKVQDSVSSLARCRLLKQKGENDWQMIAIEQSFISTALAPDLLKQALLQLKDEDDFSIYRQLHRIYPNDEFFKAHYEISIFPLTETLAKHWTGSTNSLIAVVSITYCSLGPIEMTRTWFDASRAALMAGSLDVKLLDTKK